MYGIVQLLINPYYAADHDFRTFAEYSYSVDEPVCTKINNQTCSTKGV